MRPDVAAYLWDALQAARAARSFTMNAEYSCFVDDTMRRSAVERQLEILGEALNRVRRSDPEVSARIPEIAQIIGMRNIIVHEYGNIDHRLVWDLTWLIVGWLGCWGLVVVGIVGGCVGWGAH